MKREVGEFVLNVRGLMRERELLTLDEAEISARSRERAQKTWERFSQQSA